MIEKAAKTKDMSPDASPPVKEYHFAGSGKFHPLTVTAVSREEAEKIWEKERKKVENINNQEK